ncbi:MAG: MBOAT family protein [Spirochaetaceae bacterium]|nr:MBOAT family protein [Spirochaetaceae bacterium]
MLFNSLDFAIFLPIVFVLYWLIKQDYLKIQNLLLVFASYIFYGWWDWRFLFLILFSTLVDYFVGIGLLNEENPIKRKLLLFVSIIVNLGFLGVFKYYNFFIENFNTAFSFFGKEINIYTLSIILPVGISFYTFQTLSYSIDVYRKKMNPTKDFIAFAAFVSFFPQLVAGPIERATHLLPQFYHKRIFDYNKAVDGCRQILWGLFKKIVIADNCAKYANLIFNNSDNYTGSALILGALFFSFQIYGDFSGYSDIAIGTSRLFGFDLMKNFAFPYFSRDIAEFWRRWHISLSTWFRDYIYIPLGGSRCSLWKKIRNIFLIFVVSGFWHGANWTFIVWGFLNAVYFLPLMLAKKNRDNFETVAIGKFFPNIQELFSMIITFSLTVFAWIFFRAKDLNHAFRYISGIFSKSLFSIPNLYDQRSVLVLVITLFVFLFIEWIGRNDEYAIEKIAIKTHLIFRWSFYYLIMFSLFLFTGQEQQFIYFQF